MTSPELFTSYWNNPALAKVDAVKVSISRGDGRGALFRYRKLWVLAPSKETFALEDEEEFRASYLQQLDDEGLQTITDALQRISDEAGGKPLVLLCHERDRNECHRSTFVEWWFRQTGQEVPELEPGMLDDAASQGALF